jgi:hypothetical protein
MVHISKELNAPIGNVDNSTVHLQAIVAGRARGCDGIENRGLSAGRKANQSAIE